MITTQTEYVDIDLSSLYQLSGNLIPDMNIELRLIELYSYSNRTEIFNRFTEIVLKDVYYYQEVKEPLKEINKFFKYKVFLSTVTKFIDFIEIMILKELANDKINLIDISYDSIVLDAKEPNDMLLVRFKIIKVLDE